MPRGPVDESIATVSRPQNVQVRVSMMGEKTGEIFERMKKGVKSFDPPQIKLLFHFVTQKFREAYALACLGVTERDWKMLATEALEHMEFEVARKAFYRIRDCRSLLLVHELTVLFF